MMFVRRRVLWLAAPILLLRHASGQQAPQPGKALENVTVKGKQVQRSYADWPSSGEAPGAEQLTCNDSSVPDFHVFGVNGEGYTARFCQSVRFNVYTPGFSFGNAARLPGGKGLPQGWQLTYFREFKANLATQGIKGESAVWNVYGPGDFNLDTEVNAAAGAVAPSDEVIELHRNVVAQLPSDFFGKVSNASAEVGADAIKVDCTEGCSTQGPGRYLIESTPVASGYATEITAPAERSYVPGVMTLGEPLRGVAPSTAWGVLESPCIVNQTAANTGSTCTFKVKVQSAGAFKEGSLVAASGAYHVQSYLASASNVSGGMQTLTMNAHHSIPVGGLLYQGSAKGSHSTNCTGLGIELTANSAKNIKEPFEVIGCTDSTHLAFVQYLKGWPTFDAGNLWMHKAEIGGRLSGNGAGLVRIPIPPGDGPPLVGQTVTITGSEHFNGACLHASMPDAETLECLEPGNTARGDASAGAQVTLGTTGHGNAEFNLYRMAEVLDIRNPTTGVEDGTLILEPNEMQLRAGTAVEQTQLVSQGFLLQAEIIDASSPYFAELSAGHHVTLRGAFGNGRTNPNSYAMESIDNQTPLERYAGFGGVRAAPVYANLHGLWAYSRQMQIAPQYGLDWIGCPGTKLGCADPVAAYEARNLAGDGGGLVETWTPSSNSLRLQVNRRGAANEIMYSADRISTPKPMAIGGLEQIAPNQFGGTCAMAGTTTCTVELARAYRSAICMVSAQGTSVAAGAVACNVSPDGPSGRTGTVVTVTAANPNTNTFGVILLGLQP